MREIVTLQFGNLSNYAATHFWNAQESYFTYSEEEKKAAVDHNIHWRAGIGADGNDTFLPRTVIYDLKGGFGSLRKTNTLYDASSAEDVAAASLWSGKPALHKQKPLEPSDYQKSLDSGTKPAQLTSSTVRYWSDFSRVYFHPKSLVQLYDYEIHSSILPFENFSMGTELFESLEKDDEIVDRDWRPFVEECDNMQGIQIYSTLDDAWGGFACSYLEALRDEHPKSCIWVWGLQNPVLDIPRAKRRLRLSNTAQSFHQACSQASMVVPLSVPEGRSPPSIALDMSSAWHTSGLLATAIESALLQSRLNPDGGVQPSTLADMAQSLNIAGNQTLANMRMAVGAQASTLDGDSLDIDLSQIGSPKDRIVSENSGRVFGQLASLRGVDTATDESKTEFDINQRPIVGRPVLRRYVSPLQFPLIDSYPPIYPDATGHETIQVHTVISTDSTIVARMKHLRSQIAWSVGLDERETLVNGLAEIGDAYQDDWSSGSDLDDDDL